MVGQNMRSLREWLGLHRRDIAAYLEIHESTYGKYELGKRTPSLEIVQRLAKFYDVSTDQILGNAPLDLSKNESIKKDKATKNVITLNVGQVIKNHRKRRGIEINELSESLHIDPDKITAWESGEYMPDSYMLIKISEYFNITMDELFGRDKFELAVDDGELKQKNNELFSSFTASQQEEAIRFLQYIAQKKSEKPDISSDHH